MSFELPRSICRPGEEALQTYASIRLRFDAWVNNYQTGSAPKLSVSSRFGFWQDEVVVLEQGSPE